jgi:hypothetical protein
MSANHTESPPLRHACSTDERDLELQQVREAMAGLRFGTVLVIVQDGVVVQIERTEKRRLRRPS